MRTGTMAATGAVVLAAGGLAGVALGGSTERLAFAPRTVTVNERDGQAVVTVERAGCATPKYYGHWRSPAPDDPGTATPEVDYETRQDTVLFDDCFDGSSEQRTMTIPILDDEETEGTETIALDMIAYPTTSDAVPMPLVDPAGAVVIEDDESKPPPPPPPPPPAVKSGPAGPALELPPAAPAPVAAPVQRSTATLPSSRGCTSRRRFSIRLRPRDVRLRSAIVTVDGRRVRSTRRGGRLVADVDLRTKRRARYTVTVVAKTADGRTLRETRRYRTCAKKRRG